MTVCGIDFSSTAVHLALLDDDSNAAEFHTLQLVGPTAFDRARSVRTVFPTRTWFDDHGVYLIGLEQPFSATLKAAKALGRVEGAILAWLPRDLAVIPSPPNEWQRIFLNVDRLPKDRKTAIRARAVELGLEVTDVPQDSLDAYGVAWAVRALNERAVRDAA